MIPWKFFILAALSGLIFSYLISSVLILRVKPRVSKTGRKIPPEIGGIVIFASLAITFFLSYFVFNELFSGNQKKFYAICIAGTLMFLIGLLDDHYSLSYRMKLVFEILAASILPLAGFNLGFITNIGGAQLQLPNLVGDALIIGWIIFMTNAVNLIDGLDGLAAGVIALASFTTFLLAWDKNVFVAAGAVSLSFALLGILPFNFYPARFYLGDSGSLLIGFLIAVFSLFFHLKTYMAITILIPFLILFVPILNTAMVVISRLKRGKNPFKGDIFHIHYRLLRQGMSHKATVIFLWGVSTSLCALAVIRQYFPYRPRTIVFLFGILALYAILVQVFLEFLKDNRIKKNARIKAALTNKENK